MPLSRRLGCELLFSSRRLGSTPLELPRVIGDHYREAHPAQLLRVGRFEFGIRGRRYVDLALGHACVVALRAPVYVAETETARSFDPRVESLVAPCMLWGYLENERFFTDHASVVDHAIHLPPAAEVLPEGLARPIVGVSFRRGDFNTMGWVLPLAYYEAALARLSERVRPGTLLVLGDDRDFNELVEPWLARFGPVVNGVRISEDPVVNLAMLAACDHNVIANSTFSWWGAWLAERRVPSTGERVVLAPAVWGGGRSRDDMIPDRWTVVSW